MNRDLLESQWPQVRETLRTKFSNLTEDDINQINGRYDQLVSKLQQKYGYSREEAEERIRSWNFDRNANAQRTSSARDDKFYQEGKVRKDDGISPFIWLLAIGIPLVLLGTYFYNTTRTDAPVAAHEQTMRESPSDRAISNDLRNAFFNQNISRSDLQNVQITTHNGVVTLSGTVPNNQVRNTIVDTAQNFSGIDRVINNLQVR